MIIEEVTIAGRKLFSKLDLPTQPGERVALMGRSGVGKSCLLTTLLYQLRKQAKIIGYCPQFGVLFPWLTLRDNIRFRSPHATEFQVSRMADGLRLDTKLLDRLPSEVSGGEQVRAAVARALFGNPPYVLLDEPFNNVDIVTESECCEFIRTSFQRDQCLVMATHSIDSAASACDRLVLLGSNGVVCTQEISGSIEGREILRARVIRELLKAH